MPVQVIMPQLGESVAEGTLTKWLVTQGQTIKEFEPLVEINTDKVDTEIPSPASGTVLQILVPEGTIVRVGTVLAWIGKPGELATDESRPTMGPGSQAEKGPLAVPEVSSLERIEEEGKAARELGFISPVVAKISQEYRIDLTQVRGTGLGGRITKKDLFSYLEQRGAATSNGLSAPPTEADTSTVLPGEIISITPVRRAIAEHMVYSTHTSPHVTTIMEADMSRVVAHREANKSSFARDGVNLTFTGYFAASTVAALKAYPLVNSSWSEAGILLHKQINLGLATSLGEGGLIVPVIKNAEGLSLLGLTHKINDLSNRARLRKLLPDEVKGGTFTITNHGVSGSLFATPIINQPQCAILGVGMIQKRVIVINDAIAIRPMVYLTLTFDHRILDGAIADAFLGKVVELLQNWA